MKKTTVCLILTVSLISGLISGCHKKKYQTEEDYYKILKSEPIQENINEFNITKDYINSNIIAVATYKIAAKVLSKESYSFDKESKYSPIDFALGWGEMSNKEKLEASKISISQGTRFYHWHVPSFDIFERKYIETHSANTHIIPADDQIKSYINNTVKQNDLIYLEGYLVNINDSKNKWSWKTSLTRNDTGNGACEVFYVTKIVHLP